MKNRILLLLFACMVLAATGCPPKAPNGERSDIAEPTPFTEFEGVQLKKIAGEKLAVIRCEDYMAHISDNLSKLVHWMITSQAEVVGPNTTIFYSYPGNLRRDDLDNSLLYMVGFPVHGRTMGYGDVKIFDMRDYTAACILHRGEYGNIGESYNELLNWVSQNGYKRDGFFREIYISGPGPRDPVDPNLWITEIQVKVKK